MSAGPSVQVVLAVCKAMVLIRQSNLSAVLIQGSVLLVWLLLCSALINPATLQTGLLRVHAHVGTACHCAKENPVLKDVLDKGLAQIMGLAQL